MKPQIHTDEHRYKSIEPDISLISVFIRVHLWFHFSFTYLILLSQKIFSNRRKNINQNNFFVQHRRPVPEI